MSYRETLARLKKIQNVPSEALPQLTQPGFGGSVGTSDGASQTFSPACGGGGGAAEISERPASGAAKTDKTQPAPLADPAAPCPTCGCGSYWHSGTAWCCEACEPPADTVERWLQVSGGKLAPMPAPALPWPPELNDMARRVADHFEWTADDRRDFVAWARRSPQALADAGDFLRTEHAKLPGQRQQFNSTEDTQ